MLKLLLVMSQDQQVQIVLRKLSQTMLQSTSDDLPNWVQLRADPNDFIWQLPQVVLKVVLQIFLWSFPPQEEPGHLEQGCRGSKSRKTVMFGSFSCHKALPVFVWICYSSPSAFSDVSSPGVNKICPVDLTNYVQKSPAWVTSYFNTIVVSHLC